MKRILVTGGDDRFSNELKNINTNFKFIYLNKKQLNIYKKLLISLCSIGRVVYFVYFLNQYDIYLSAKKP